MIYLNLYWKSFWSFTDISGSNQYFQLSRPACYHYTNIKLLTGVEPARPPSWSAALIGWVGHRLVRPACIPFHHKNKPKSFSDHGVSLDQGPTDNLPRETASRKWQHFQELVENGGIEPHSQRHRFYRPPQIPVCCSLSVVWSESQDSNLVYDHPRIAGLPLPYTQFVWRPQKESNSPPGVRSAWTEIRRWGQ